MIGMEEMMSAKTMYNDDHFVSLNVRASVLRKMLQGENLHMSDIQCSCSKSKQVLQKLLIQAVSNTK